MSEKMISSYLRQGEQYYSESKETFLQVSEMHPTHAANAAARYMAEAFRWAKEAGDGDVARPMLWMIRRPLFLALVARAAGQPSPAPRDLGASRYCAHCGNRGGKMQADPSAEKREGERVIIRLHDSCASARAQDV